MANQPELKTLGDYRKTARDLLYFYWSYEEKESNSDYDIIRFALSHIQYLIYSSRSSPLLDGIWRTSNYLKTKDSEYQIRNSLLFDIIKLMEFSVAYKRKSIDEIFPELQKIPNTKAIVFTDAGLSYFEAAFKFVNDIGKNIISYLQNSYMKHNKNIHIVYADPFVFLRKTPTIDDLVINPEPDVIIKEWFELTLTRFKKLFPEQEYSQHKIEAEFNLIRKQLEYEWNLWKKRQGTEGQGEIPSDLIDLAKAVGLYHRSRAQIKRDIQDGKIKDYRKIEKGKHWISRSEADSLYISK